MQQCMYLQSDVCMYIQRCTQILGEVRPYFFFLLFLLHSVDILVLVFNDFGRFDGAMKFSIVYLMFDGTINIILQQQQ